MIDGQDQVTLAGDGTSFGEFRPKRGTLTCLEASGNGQSVDMASASDSNVIACKYLLICPIPFFRDDDGSIWLDALWHHDLMEHLVYIGELTVIAPEDKKGDRQGLKRVVVPDDRILNFRPLPDSRSHIRAVLFFPKTVLALSRAVSSADIVHSGVIGWPYPNGMIANPLALLLRKKLIIVIESSPWRISDDRRASARARIRAWVTEAFARWSVRNAHLAVFTSTAYRDSLGAGMTGKALVSPATWINEADILSRASAADAWSSKSGPLKFIFAGRLTAQKGLLTLLDALEELDRRGVEIVFDIIGQGEMHDLCKQRLAGLAHVRANLLPLVPYGKAFFSLIRGYDAIVVPSLSDEQPRIIFDAYSQAVPVIASATSGHRDCVGQDTGSLVPVADARALADLLDRFGGQRDALRAFGMAARDVALSHTHKAMHAVRADLIRDMCHHTDHQFSRRESSVP